MSSSEDFIFAIVNSAKHNREQKPVGSNQRALFEKILQRYSSDFVVFRELIQNADDAQAKSFQIQFICSDHLHDDQPQQKTGLFTNIGNFFRKESNEKIEDKFHQCVVTEIRTVNDGLIFNEDDWKRVTTVAEGNADVNAVGQFGVGFFTVFSYSNRPVIKSGKHCLVFHWEDDGSLMTSRAKLPSDTQSSMTSVILVMQDKCVLDTKSKFDFDLEPFGAEAVTTEVKKTKRSNNDPKLRIHLARLKAFLLKMLSFTKHIHELTITIDGETVFQVEKSSQPCKFSSILSAAKLPNLTDDIHSDLFQFKRLMHVKERYELIEGSSITLDLINVELTVDIEDELHDQIQKVILKRLPKTIHIKLLMALDSNIESWSSNDKSYDHRLLETIAPVKWYQNQLIPCGQIFIGLSTQQTTGLGMHLHSQFIPTVERENLDFQNPYVGKWNEEILRSAGRISRFIYDQIIVDRSQQDYRYILNIYSFTPTSPKSETGIFLRDEFISIKKDILVPVKKKPSDNEISLVRSNCAFLVPSDFICEFLHQSIVPFEISKLNYFNILRQYQRINQIDHSIILDCIRNTTLLSTELVALLRWLTTEDANQKSYVNEVFRSLHFCDSQISSTFKLTNVQYFDHYKILADLPLPSNILPYHISSHLSDEELEKKLFLSVAPFEHLLNFYLYQEEQHYLLLTEKTSTCILLFISQYWNQCDTKNKENIKTILARMKCVPTSRGMKTPKQAYIYPTNSSQRSLPLIELKSSINVQFNNGSLPVEFLKDIGCRTFYIPSVSSSNSDFIRQIVVKRKSMSKTDIEALKQKPILDGITLDMNTDQKMNKYRPDELHFPSVAMTLQWSTLPILDWTDDDLKPYSEEYLFLEEIGVREKPSLQMLLDRIVEEHQKSSMTTKDYELPSALVFLIENFQNYYLKFWTVQDNQRAFLPCYYSSRSFNQRGTKNVGQVMLQAPNFVFTNESPLFPTPIPALIDLFKLYNFTSLISIKANPTFGIICELIVSRKVGFLTVNNAKQFFTYFGSLDRPNRTEIQELSHCSFIPIPGRPNLAKPNEVFIPVASSSSDENVDTTGLIDYIDYGSEANEFLQSIGVVHYPSPETLVELLLDRQAHYFSDTANNLELLKHKLNVYKKCLIDLAITLSRGNISLNEPLRLRLVHECWCLGYRSISAADGATSNVFSIVKPSDIYLIDDEQCLNLFQPLHAPDDPDLVKLYERFGAQWLSTCTTRQVREKGKSKRTDETKAVKTLIQERLDLLFFNQRNELVPDADLSRLEKLRTNLEVFQTETIQCRIIFLGNEKSLKEEESSSCVLKHENDQIQIFIRQNLPLAEYNYDLARELARFVCGKARDDVVEAICNKLSSSSRVLQRRGYRMKSSESPALTYEPISSKHNKSDRTDFYGNSCFKQTNSSSIQDDVTHSKSQVHNFAVAAAHLSRLLMHALGKVAGHSPSEITLSKPTEHSTPSDCTTPPKTKLKHYETLFYSIPFFIQKKSMVTQNIRVKAEQLGAILGGLATQVFRIPLTNINLFYDIDSDYIAFNDKGSLFFNVRYLEQVYRDAFPSSSLAARNEALVEVTNFYFVLVCHELTHNLHTNHDSDFTVVMEGLIVKFLSAKEKYLAKPDSMNDWQKNIPFQF